MDVEELYSKKALGSPTVVYKYRNLQSLTESRLLTHQEIFLAPPSIMKLKGSNDCQFIPEYLDKHLLASRYKYFLAQLADLPNKEDVASMLALDHPFFSEQNRKEATKLLQIEIDSNLGLFCCSKSWDNLDLWHNFADQGHGICIGLNFEKLKSTVGFNVGGSILYFPQSQPPMIKTDGSPNYSINEVVRTILSMPAQFQEEEEYRLGKVANFQGKDARKILLPLDCFEEIILGVNCSKLPQSKLIEELKYMGKVYRIKMQQESSMLIKKKVK